MKTIKLRALNDEQLDELVVLCSILKIPHDEVISALILASSAPSVVQEQAVLQILVEDLKSRVGQYGAKWSKMEGIS